MITFFSYKTHMYISQIRRVILINCGGTIDLMELFENPTDVIIFVIDSHRPTHILNIYNESKQVNKIIPLKHLFHVGY